MCIGIYVQVLFSQLFSMIFLPLSSQIKIPVLLSRISQLSKGLNNPMEFSLDPYAESGRQDRGSMPRQCSWPLENMGQRKGSHLHLLRAALFSLLCAFLKCPTCLIWLSGVDRNHKGKSKDPEIQALAQSPHLGQFILLLLCLIHSPAPP